MFLIERSSIALTSSSCLCTVWNLLVKQVVSPPQGRFHRELLHCIYKRISRTCLIKICKAFNTKTVSIILPIPNMENKLNQKIVWIHNQSITITKTFAQINALVYESNYNTSHKFWDQSPSPHYQCCLQVSGTVSW